MIIPNAHAHNVEVFEDWMKHAPMGDWCSYDPPWPKAESALMSRVRKAYVKDKKVLLFQQRHTGALRVRTEYMAVRVSPETWARADALSDKASYAFGARMKGKLEEFLAGQGVAS